MCSQPWVLDGECLSQRSTLSPWCDAPSEQRRFFPSMRLTTSANIRPATSSPSSPTASRSICATRARGTISIERVRAAGPGRSADDRAPRRGARATARQRRRQESARRLSPRRQHPARRGEEGRRGRLRRRARCRARSCCRKRRRSPTRSPAAGAEARERVASEDSKARCARWRALRAPVDAFFLKVTVNADDPELRLNRLRLLGELRDAVHTVADFSKIAG